MPATKLNRVHAVHGGALLPQSEAVFKARNTDFFKLISGSIQLRREGRPGETGVMVTAESKLGAARAQKGRRVNTHSR